METGEMGNYWRSKTNSAKRGRKRSPILCASSRTKIKNSVGGHKKWRRKKRETKSPQKMRTNQKKKEENKKMGQ